MIDYKDFRFTPEHDHTRKWRTITISVLLIIGAIIAPFLLSKLFTVNKKTTVTHELTLPTPKSKPIAKDAKDPTTPDEAADSITQDILTTIIVQPGDSLAKLFQAHGISPLVIQQILPLDEHTQSLRHIRPGEQISLELDIDGQFKQLHYPLNKKECLIVTHSAGEYATQVKRKALEPRTRFGHGTIEHSLYLSAKRAYIPEKIIQQLGSVFAWNIDFAKELRAGDNFVVLYDEYYAGDERVETGNILAARFTNQGDIYTAIRHTDDDGNVAYYTAEGDSLRKAFLRYPVKFSHISSHFNPRRMHPILKILRPHNGVDFAAAIGTPIKASGDGKITFIGNNGGYGNMIKIQHNNELTTLYAHMLRFANGVKKGDSVKQDQVIGYVGQSGMATGPHLHYEFHVNGKPTNPVTVDLPDAQPINDRYLDEFLLSSGTMIAQLDLYENTQLALAAE